MTKVRRPEPPVIIIALGKDKESGAILAPGGQFLTALHLR
jgi:hypothetical protein